MSDVKINEQYGSRTEAIAFFESVKNSFLFLEVKAERQKAADLGACQENTYVSEFFDQKFELPKKKSQWSTSKCRHGPDLGKDNPSKLQETISRRSEGVGSSYFVRRSVVEGIFDSDNFLYTTG